MSLSKILHLCEAILLCHINSGGQSVWSRGNTADNPIEDPHVDCLLDCALFWPPHSTSLRCSNVVPIHLPVLLIKSHHNPWHIIYEHKIFINVGLIQKNQNLPLISQTPQCQERKLEGLKSMGMLFYTGSGHTAFQWHLEINWTLLWLISNWSFKCDSHN